MNTEKINQQIFTCECHGDAIYVVKFDDEELIYFSIRHHKGKHKPPISQRLKRIWKILTTGTPYGDEVILNKEKSLQLSSWLQNNLNNNETSTQR